MPWGSKKLAVFCGEPSPEPFQFRRQVRPAIWIAGSLELVFFCVNRASEKYQGPKSEEMRHKDSLWGCDQPLHGCMESR